MHNGQGAPPCAASRWIQPAHILWLLMQTWFRLLRARPKRGRRGEREAAVARPRPEKAKGWGGRARAIAAIAYFRVCTRSATLAQDVKSARDESACVVHVRSRVYVQLCMLAVPARANEKTRRKQARKERKERAEQEAGERKAGGLEIMYISLSLSSFVVCCYTAYLYWHVLRPSSTRIASTIC